MVTGGREDGDVLLEWPEPIPCQDRIPVAQSLRRRMGAAGAVLAALVAVVTFGYVRTAGKTSTGSAPAPACAPKPGRCTQAALDALNQTLTQDQAVDGVQSNGVS